MTRLPNASLQHRLAALLLCSAAVWLQPCAAAETELADEDPALAALEQQFWDCDYLATRFALSPQDGGQCVIVHDELKGRRFGGDFTRLLAWWQSHKAVEHGLRARAHAAAADEEPLEWPNP